MMTLFENSPSTSERATIIKQINDIKQWISVNYGIDCYNENFFNNFLFRCNFDELLCKKKIMIYFRNKKRHVEFFQAGDLNEDGFRSFCSSIYSLYLPKLSSNGCRIFVDKVTNDENLFDIFKIMKYYCMQTDLIYSEEGYDNGDVILFDCNNMKFFNLMAFTPYFIKSLILLLEMYPLRIKLLVLINTGPILEICVRLLKLLFLKKFDNLIYAYSGGHEFFSKYVGSDVLPRDYNGELPSLDQLRDSWLTRLDQKHDWFFQVNDQIKNSLCTEWDLENIFGTDGSFKKLQID